MPSSAKGTTAEGATTGANIRAGAGKLGRSVGAAIGGAIGAVAVGIVGGVGILFGYIAAKD